MSTQDASSGDGGKCPDVLVVGGGVIGLWIARRCLAAGLSVTLLERDRIRSGASGGVLGALTPYAPDAWSPKKAFQLTALASLPAEIARLEAETGIRTGYGRVGRLQPLFDERARDAAEIRAEASRAYWAEAGARLIVGDGPPPSGPAGIPAPFGWAFDDLSARIDPAAYMRALAAAVRVGGATVIEETQVHAVLPEGPAVLTSRGPIAAGHVVIAAGHGSFPLLEGLTGRSLGHGVLGQALVLEAPWPADAPLVTHDGTYVVGHADGRLAIGSTVERDAAGPSEPARTDLVAAAIALAPALASARIAAHWAGVRPNCERRSPMIGRLPDHPRIFVGTGTYGIGFALAHGIAAALAASILETEQIPLPSSFDVVAHLSRGR